jgi:hypothetical protein
VAQLPKTLNERLLFPFGQLDGCERLKCMKASHTLDFRDGSSRHFALRTKADLDLKDLDFAAVSARRNDPSISLCQWFSPAKGEAAFVIAEQTSLGAREKY